MKDKVQEVVWRRVVSDYTAREAALEEQAAPLKAQVRAEYQKLRGLLDRTKERNEAAGVEKSELEFRHAVGELTQKQLDEKLRAPQKVLDQCAADLAAIDEQKARFLAAFSSEQEIELPPPAPRKTASVTAATPPSPALPEPVAEPEATILAPNPLLKRGSAAGAPTSAAPDVEPDATMLAPNPLLAAKASMPPESDATMLAPNPLLQKDKAAPAASVESDATFVVTPEQLEAMKKAAADADTAQKSAGAADDRTFMLPVAWLVVNSDSPAPSEFRLGASNSLGRADDSSVILARPGVSRRHAIILAGTTGFTIKDLESQNGTFVNGQRITEHPLADGDQIVIGDAKIVFKTQFTGQPARS